MTRPSSGMRLAGAALGWLAGVAVQLQQAALDAPRVHLALMASAIALCAVPGRWRWPALCVGMALAGYGVTGWHAASRLADALAPDLERLDLQVSGVVSRLPQATASGLRFGFDVERASRDGAPVRLPGHVELGWNSGFDDEAAPTPLQRELRAGQRWRFAVRLRRPHGQLNPHGGDHELTLFEEGVRATGYVRGAAVFLGDSGTHRIDRWRQQVRDAMSMAVPDARAAGVLAALAVGDQAAISRDDWEVFRNTGVAHLMSISGLHVTMFAWLAGGLIRAAWARWRRGALLLPAPLAGRWGGLAVAAAYAVLSGWGVPAQRTVWMIATAALLASSGRRWPWLLVLLAAAWTVTAFDPWALLRPGFWLSFTAVGILLAAGPAQAADAAPAAPDRLTAARQRVGAAVAGGVRAQLVAAVALTPLTLVFFGQMSLVGFAANLVAIPLVTLLVTPLALLGALLAPLWTLAAALVGWFVALLGWLAAWPGAVWTVGVAPWWAQVSGLVGGLLLVLPLPRRARLAALPLLVPLLVPPRDLPPRGGYDLLAADVGQGTAVLVRTRSHLLVYDAGPRYSPASDAGGRVLLPLLRARGETRIDMLVLSHRDSDHVGGAAALLRGLPVGRLLSSLEPGHSLLAMGTAHTPCQAGQHWEWDGVTFDVLHPPAERYRPAAKSNALSCVLRIGGTVAGQPRIALLAGDIERGDEASLVERYGGALASDVLLVPHHGSRTSSSAAFLDAVGPRAAVVQAGYLNRFGHPAPDVVERYAARAALVFDTADCGAWHDGDATACERDRRRRYWHHPGRAGHAP